MSNNNPESIGELQEKNLINEKNLPVLGAFRDKLSWGNLVNSYYIEQKFCMKKSGRQINNIDELIREYSDQKIIIKTPAGYGKTTALKKIYFGEYQRNFYYIRALAFTRARNDINHFEGCIRDSIADGVRINGTILIDGLEEAFNDPSEASEFIINLCKSKNCFWFACRSDFFEELSTEVDSEYSDIAVVEEWDETSFFEFVDEYVSNTGLLKVKDKIITLLNNFSVQDKKSLYCPLYATMLVFLFSDDDYEIEDEIKDEYDLMGRFVTLYLEREIKEKKIGDKKVDEYIEKLREIAIGLYNKKNTKLGKDFGVLKGFVQITSKGSNIIRGFIHKEFLVYFVVDGMLSAANNEIGKIVKYYANTFFDDVTNLYKKVMIHSEQNFRKSVYDGLVNAYKLTYEDKTCVKKFMEKLEIQYDDLAFLKLRDELLYYILKTPVDDYDEFVSYAYNHADNDYMLYLGIAYGMAGIRQNKYTFQFAQKLIPGTNEEKINRGWAVCFFGDVKEDGFTYKDEKKCSWAKVRKKKIRRISINEEKEYRYRLLDFPLLYCFYHSRGFEDCNSIEEYKVIKNSVICFDQYTEEEAVFLKGIKEKLIEEYKRNLLGEEISQHQQEYLALFTNEESGGKTELDIKLEDTTEKMIEDIIELRDNTDENLRYFWENNGEAVLKKYRSLKNEDNKFKILNENQLNKKLEGCEVLVLSANYVEGKTISNCLIKKMQGNTIKKITGDNLLYQFAKIGDKSIVHIWPQSTSSFTIHGSFLSLKAAFERFTPKYVISLGVAFGASPKEQSLGDVLIADHLIFYDSFNKMTDGKLTLSTDEVQIIGDSIFAGCTFFNEKKYPRENDIGEFDWYKGTLLTGGTVLSDAIEKFKLFSASEKMQIKPIGGEMEGSGVYFACNGREAPIPFTVIKGICDWAVNKNGWDFVSKDKEEKEQIKNSIQSYACQNAFSTFEYMLANLS